jgi:hypothetical protein
LTKVQKLDFKVVFILYVFFIPAFYFFRNGAGIVPCLRSILFFGVATFLNISDKEQGSSPMGIEISWKEKHHVVLK